MNKGQKFLCMCSRTRENDKKQSGPNVLGHPVELDIKILDMIDIIFSEKDKTEMPSFRQEMSVVDIIGR